MEYRPYKPGPRIDLGSSTSLVHRNLCAESGLQAENGISYGVVHKATANIVHVSPTGECTRQEVDYEPTKDKDPMACIIQIKWCRLKNLRKILVLTSYKGFQILEWDGTSQLYLNKFETPQNSFMSRFARGVATVGDMVCVGTSDGPILMLSALAQGSDITFTRQLRGHLVPISDLATNSRGQLASCDDSGCIIVWLDPLLSDESSVVISDASIYLCSGLSKLEVPEKALDGIPLINEIPCTSLCFWETLLIGGFTNGQIVIYNSESGAKMVEIAAHARCINALDVAHASGLLLSASEDSTASVWKLPTSSEPKVTHLFSTTVADTILCGGQFCDSKGEGFALSGFDSDQLLTYTSN